jgi:hypothetical protein
MSRDVLGGGYIYSDGEGSIEVFDECGNVTAFLRFAAFAPRVIVSDPSTDCATGHCECGACGGAIDPWDAWCRHCGAKVVDE